MLLGLAWFLATFAESDHRGWYTMGRDRPGGRSRSCSCTPRSRSRTDGCTDARGPPAGRRHGARASCSASCRSSCSRSSSRCPRPYTSCTADCPPNALFALDAEPASLSAACARPARCSSSPSTSRWSRGSGGAIGDARSITRRMLAAGRVVRGRARAALMGVAIVARQAGPDQPAIEIGGVGARARDAGARAGLRDRPRPLPALSRAASCSGSRATSAPRPTRSSSSRSLGARVRRSGAAARVPARRSPGAVVGLRRRGRSCCPARRRPLGRRDLRRR